MTLEFAWFLAGAMYGVGALMIALEVRTYNARRPPE